ncbi:MAG: hypothetical protein EBR51_07805 [Gammaproteobacteria bacterium]|nr:hypothetical protein [Gammaproteobacteria bacterium]
MFDPNAPLVVTAFQLFVLLHILAGSIGLITFWVPVVGRVAPERSGGDHPGSQCPGSDPGAGADSSGQCPAAAAEKAAECPGSAAHQRDNATGAFPLIGAPVA